MIQLSFIYTSLRHSNMKLAIINKSFMENIPLCLCFYVYVFRIRSDIMDRIETVQTELLNTT